MISTIFSLKKFQLYSFTFLLLLFCSQSAFAFRCGTHLITEGDLSIRVKQYCGEPDWIDRWYEKLVFAENTIIEHSLDNISERWVYNLGPRQFMRFVLIRNNRVISIDTGDYGFNLPEQTKCDSNSFTLGMPALEVKAKCGEPDAKNRRFETVSKAISKDTKGQITVPVDEWIYNLGPQVFVRILTFSHGELIDIKTGSRGF